MNADDHYRSTLVSRLREVGAEIDTVEAASQQVRQYLPACEYLHISYKESKLLLTSGCCASTHAGSLKYEFVVGCPGAVDLYRTLIEYVAYYHASRRHIQLAECLEIGATNIDSKFTHIFTSVPYFFPPEINFIEIENFKYHLVWLMPLRAEEARFLQEEGVDAFEARLDASGYGYFEDRVDLSYLRPS